MIRHFLVAHPAGAFASHSAPGRIVPSQSTMGGSDSPTAFSHPSFCWVGLPASNGDLGFGLLCFLGLFATSLWLTLRAGFQPFKIAPGDFVP